MPITTNTPGLVHVGLGPAGGVWRAPTGTTAPTTPTATYAAGWETLGLISNDGIELAPSVSTNDIRARDGSLIRRYISESEFTFNFTAIETNTNTLKAYFPGATISAAAGVQTVTIVSPVSNIQAWAFDVTDGSVHQRLIIPTGEVRQNGSVSFSVGEGQNFPLTMSVYPGSTGTAMLLLTDDAAFV
jgi:hypothetical protein